MSDFHLLLEEQIPQLMRYASALTRDSDEAAELVEDTVREAHWPTSGTAAAPATLAFACSPSSTICAATRSASQAARSARHGAIRAPTSTCRNSTTRSASFPRSSARSSC